MPLAYYFHSMGMATRNVVARARTLRISGVVALTLVLLLAWRVFTGPDFDRIRVDSLEALESEMEALRVSLGIPGMSAAAQCVSESSDAEWPSATIVTLKRIRSYDLP